MMDYRTSQSRPGSGRLDESVGWVNPELLIAWRSQQAKQNAFVGSVKALCRESLCSLAHIYIRWNKHIIIQRPGPPGDCWISNPHQSSLLSSSCLTVTFLIQTRIACRFKALDGMHKRKKITLNVWNCLGHIWHQKHKIKNVNCVVRYK